MTYEERQQAICKECIEGAKCPYKSRNLEHKCPNLSDNMFGWELGYEDAISKACEYLKNNYEDLGIRYMRGHKVEDEIELFKEYMNEQSWP